jgi:hypothetical protein
MIATVRLDEASVNAVAKRVAELLRGKSTGDDFIDAAEVGRRFSLSRDYVYEHADELGAIRLGNGSRARLRFDPATVRERLTHLTVRDSETEPQRANQRSVRSRGSVDLLPVKGQ